MYKPGLEDFRQLALEAGLVPVCREIVADLDTPLTVFAKLAGNESHAFLLESLEGGETWGRYSFVGYDPLLTFESRGSQIKVRRQGDDLTVLSGDPLAELKKLLASFKACTDTDFLPRFFGGAVGYLGYEMVRFMERLPEKNPPLADLPESSFMVPRFILIFDNLKQTLSVVNCVRVAENADLDRVYQQALADIDTVIASLKSSTLPHDVVEGDGPFASHEFTANMEPEAFREMVAKAKEYIMAGDIIQVVLSQRFQTKTAIPPFLLYRALRHVNPSPYLFYVRMGDVIQIGSSPEILVRLEEKKVEVRTIAGTRPRGKNRQEDLALEQELLADPKECAEHLMLVDLGRNDLGRVARYGTVETYELMVVERYSHVMHIVSGVRGELAEGYDQFDVVRACFPAGTVSGAPKVRAMEIIDELEPERRGPYAGAVGYFGFSGNMDFSITIRTFIMYGKDLWVQAGAGVVADSDPEMEYQETLNKLRGVRRAVELAEKGI
ncbi:MAG: anthranilate synthase component I [Deltaproteobacteria bacterium]|jgi:anthranilate synthase component 1|nr:anthranilate synthase component I [Deltaproteobacteria bacterium]